MELSTPPVSNRYRILTLFILILAIALRIELVSVNREANDDHYEVVSLILKNGALPEKNNCWECFQPKLFHYTTAQVLQIIQSDTAYREEDIILVGEWLNVISGILTLLVLKEFINHLPEKSETLKLLAFGLLALNPKLIGINAQATNDSFAILFSTLALYTMLLFLQKQKVSTFLWMLLFCLLGISSKTNVWITAMAIPVVLLIKGWLQTKQGTKCLLLGILFLAATAVLSILNPLNQYVFNYQEYGSPVLMNIGRQPFPHFAEKTEVKRPGILSIADGYFTFKFYDLLKYPLIENGNEYHANRTSLWTQLYGRGHSVHFDNWPPSWSTQDDRNYTLTRAIFILALLPTVLFLFGAAAEGAILLKSIIKRTQDLAATLAYGLPVVTFLGYIGFMVLYSLLYRDFAVMKAIFIFPALICYHVFFLRAAEKLISCILHRFPWIQRVLIGWIVCLLVLYTIDILTMIQLIYSRM